MRNLNLDQLQTLIAIARQDEQTLFCGGTRLIV